MTKHKKHQYNNLWRFYCIFMIIISSWHEKNRKNSSSFVTFFFLSLNLRFVWSNLFLIESFHHHYISILQKYNNKKIVNFHNNFRVRSRYFFLFVCIAFCYCCCCNLACLGLCVCVCSLHLFFLPPHWTDIFRVEFIVFWLFCGCCYKIICMSIV